MTQQPRTIEVPYYVHEAVLKPGAAIYAQIDGREMRLIVDHVEPALICRAPDGTELVLLAHMVVPADD